MIKKHHITADHIVAADHIVVAMIETIAVRCIAPGIVFEVEAVTALVTAAFS